MLRLPLGYFIILMSSEFWETRATLYALALIAAQSMNTMDSQGSVELEQDRVILKGCVMVL